MFKLSVILKGDVIGIYRFHLSYNHIVLRDYIKTVNVPTTSLDQIGFLSILPIQLRDMYVVTPRDTHLYDNSQGLEIPVLIPDSTLLT